jgi:hypothetical protein
MNARPSVGRHSWNFVVSTNVMNLRCSIDMHELASSPSDLLLGRTAGEGKHARLQQ